MTEVPKAIERLAKEEQWREQALAMTLPVLPIRHGVRVGQGSA